MILDFDALEIQALDVLPALEVSPSSVTLALWADRAVIYGPGSALVGYDLIAGSFTENPRAYVAYYMPSELFVEAPRSETHTPYSVRLLTDVEVSSSVSDASTLGGRAALTVAEIDLWNGDRAFDGIAQLDLSVGRAITIKTAAAPSPSASDCGGSLASAATMFSGIVASYGAPGRRVALQLSDLGESFANPLQPALYDGYGGLGGTPDLRGKPKPVAFGYVFNLTPVYLGLVDFGDGALPTYQTHWRQVFAHMAVRERGAPMAQTGVRPNLGEWRDWPVQGCFQIGFTADGAITCDVMGDAPAGVYAGSTADVLTRLLTTLGPELGLGDLDTDTFARQALRLTGEIGWSIGAEQTTGGNAVDAILAGCGGVLGGGRDGRLRLADIVPNVATVHLTLGVADIVSLIPLALPTSLTPTPNQVQIAAAQNWTVQTDIAGSVTDPLRSAIAGSGRSATASSDAVALRQATARTLSLPGLYRLEVDALTRAQAIMNWMAPGVRAYQVVTDRYLDQVEIGHTAQVTYPYYGLDQGFIGTVVAWAERARGRRLTLTLVG